ncbi:hypothetical protein BDW60DRAFT_176991 [Aspergillus nidulans var. acristatus]
MSRSNGTVQAGDRPSSNTTGTIPAQENSEVEYFVVPYVLSMTPTSASLLFELEFNGVSYGSVRTRY